MANVLASGATCHLLVLKIDKYKILEGRLLNSPLIFIWYLTTLCEEHSEARMRCYLREEA